MYKRVDWFACVYIMRDNRGGRVYAREAGTDGAPYREIVCGEEQLAMSERRCALRSRVS